MLFLWVCIIQWSHMECLWCGCGCIQFAWVGSWSRSLICLPSWIWRLFWILRCWRGLWQPAYRPWAWLLSLGSICCILRLWILSCYFIFPLVARCRLISYISRLYCDCLECLSLWWMWFFWFFKMRPPTPFARCPNSFADDVLHFFVFWVSQ